MSALALLILLATAEPKLELRGPDRMGEPPAGTPPVLYAGEPDRRDDSRTNTVIVVAGGVLIVVAFYLTTRQRKRPPDQEPGP